MSRNGSGTYTLPAGNPVVSGTVIATTWANNTMNDLASAMTDSVAADGQTPMTGPLNMNSNKVTNLATGTISGDGINFTQFNTPTFGGAVTCSTTLTVVGDTTMSGTGQLKIPNGTTGQRSATPVSGMIRFNSTLNSYEGYTSYTGATISTITFVTTTATLTTATAHGLNTGNTVFITGTTPAAYSGTFVITVTGTTTFTYTMLSTPSGNATVMGSYVYGNWAQIGGGATGAGGDQIFVENGVTVTANYTLSTNKNAMSVGPITINSGVTVTVPSGQRWVVL
tara:strand:+ start:1715 stop:2560 length:846 start_codon:yes stop_codon:yes gene_type:complete